MERKKSWYLILALVGVATVIAILMSHRSPKIESSYSTLSDTSSGLSFNVSKTFQPIPKEELATLNPGFGYGFRPADDPTTYCVVAQNKLAGSGVLTGTQLRDGILKEVRKLHPNISLTNPKTASRLVAVGEAKGVLLQLTLKDEKVQSDRVELLAVGKTSQVTAYCQTRSVNSAKYYNDFTILFSSLKLSS